MNQQKIPEPEKFEGMSIFRPPLCHELTGKRFLLEMDDGYIRQLELTDNDTLLFGKADTAPGRYRYDCLKPEENTFLINIEQESVFPRIGYTIVLDLDQSLITLAIASMGQDPKYPKMPAIRFVFGGILNSEGAAPSVRHGYTPDLVGRAINWNYGTFDVVHVYSSERYYRVAFSPRRMERMRERMRADGTDPDSGPRRGAYEDYAAYIKIKDGLYLVSLLETQLCRSRGHGNSLLFLMNLNTMHDVGRSFGTNDQGENENYVFGAFGEDYDAGETLAKPSLFFVH